MTGTTHQLIALLAGCWVATLHPVFLGPILGTLAIVAVMIGALTPDLDQPTAGLFRRVLGGKAVHKVFSTFSGGHRHFTHSLLGIVSIYFFLHWGIITLLQPEFYPRAFTILTVFMIGYISHSFADTLTDQGVPWLWPIPWNIKFPPGPEEVRVTTGSFVELFLVRGGLIVALFLVISSHWEPLIHIFLSR